MLEKKSAFSVGYLLAKRLGVDALVFAALYTTLFEAVLLSRKEWLVAVSKWFHRMSCFNGGSGPSKSCK